MGITERKEREKQLRVQSILEAATQVLQEKGMEAATVNDVAHQAELGKGTLYLYFQSKDDILAALCNEALQELHASFKKAAKKEKEGRLKILAIGQAYFEFYERSPLKFQLINFINHTTPTNQPPSTQMESCIISAMSVIGFMVECLEQGKEDGSVSQHVDSVQTALILWSCSTGFIQTLSIHGQHLHDHMQIQTKKFTDYFFSMLNSMLVTYQPN